MERQEILVLRYLEYVYERTVERTYGRISPTIGYDGAVTISAQAFHYLWTPGGIIGKDRELPVILEILQDRGLILLHRANRFYQSWYVQITNAGAQAVAAERNKRAESATRRGACRDAIVRYLHQKLGPLIHFYVSPESVHQGSLYSVDEINAAQQYLIEHELLSASFDSMGSIYSEKLTARGVDCIDHFGGSVEAYLRASRLGTVRNNVTFTDAVSGPVAWDSHDFDQKVMVGTSAEQLITILRGIIEAVPALGLTADAATELVETATEAQVEIGKSDGDSNRVRDLLKRIGSLLGNTASGALSAVFKAQMNSWLQKLGIPVNDSDA